MARRFNYTTITFSIVAVIGFLILTGSLYIQENWQNSGIVLKNQYSTNSVTHESTYDGVATKNIDTIIQKTQTKIKFALKKYNFTYSDVRILEDLLVEARGRPIQSLVISSWRSGSTFFGDILQSIPGTYYHYEPLLKYGIVQIRSPPVSTQAVNNIKNMFKCNYDEMEDYFEFGKSDQLQFRQNKWLWDICKHKTDLCYDAKFTSRFCKLFPFQVMKLCRLRLRFVQDILDDEELNVKVILLIRDPRGVMNSRRHRYFCQTGLDCWQPELLCADMIRDYMAASKLLSQYPNRLMAIRFEDLALNPRETIHRVFKFLRLSYTQTTEEFLKTHTNDEVVGFDSTYRISKKVPFKWQNLLDYSDVNEIQIMCKEAMNLWGYRLAHNKTHMASKAFNALGDYSIGQDLI